MDRAARHDEVFPDPGEWVALSSCADLEAFLRARGHDAAIASELVRYEQRTPTSWDDDTRSCYVHRSLLTPNRLFPAAGDAESVGFAERIVAEMTDTFGIDRDEAVQRFNRHFNQLPHPPGWTITNGFAASVAVYHDDRDGYWANTIYYGPESFWWVVGHDPEPLPHP